MAVAPRANVHDPRERWLCGSGWGKARRGRKGRGARCAALLYAQARQGCARTARRRRGLEIGVLGDSGPEIRIQTLFRDKFVSVVRKGHPLLDAAITPQRYAACERVVASAGC
jgi:hypothetical protein